MHAIAKNSTLYEILMGLCGVMKKTPAPIAKPALIAPVAYNPVALVSLSCLGKLRRTLANAAHLSEPTDAEVLFDHVGKKTFRSSTERDGELADLERAAEEFDRNERIEGVWGFGACVVRSKITGELGLSITRDVPERNLAQLHALPEYETLRTAMGVPTSLVRFFNDDEAVENYEFYVRCFLRVDQLSEVGTVRRTLEDIAKALLASPKA